ncbi:MAG: hypothetical protein DMG15_17015 [Acidobacteria bacterium]|nr:MAG: hypothetical protein DMG15_17015 [Acidobacteriota bacterium]
MLDKGETTQMLLKLIDACTECRQIFHAESSAWTNAVQRHTIEKVQQKLDQFGIELRSEIRRLGDHDDLGIFPFETLRRYSGDVAFGRVLDRYQQALNSRLTPHSRAMLKRQYSDLRQAYQELDSVQGAG